MYKLQWLKIDANLFANRKIQILLKEFKYYLKSLMEIHILEYGYNY